MPIILGDCVDELKNLDEDSIDSIVTDPPYGLKLMGKEFDDLGEGIQQKEWHKRWAVEAFRVLKPGGYLLAFGGTRTYHHLATAVEESGFEIRDQIQWLYGSGFPKGKSVLKPANEPIVMARKPFIGSIKNNVERFGTGSLNIDDCRIGENAGWSYPNGAGGSEPHHMQRGEKKGNANAPVKATKGRWPSNVIMDEFISSELEKSKFFYCAKPSKKEKGSENNHPTVKPIELIRYLQRLVTPPKGITLDPFLGSGTSAISASLEDFEFIGIEKDKGYYNIAISRIEKS